jgi:predicted metalloprotease with PDZ domain
MLWIAEGITSYYDDITLLRMGAYSKEEYLKIITSQMSRLENSPGKTVMSLAHSSLLAWVKAYLPNEESSNKTISYYNKGMIVAVLLDLEIRSTSNYSLDDVMRKLYANFYLEKNCGFTYDEFVDVCSSIAGKDMSIFLNEIVYSLNPINYDIFMKFGLDLAIDKSYSTKPWSGISTELNGNRIIVTNIISNSPGVESGLSVNDEIIALDDWRLKVKFEDYLSYYSIGERIKLVYSRDGKMQTTHLRLLSNPTINFNLSVAEETNKKLLSWLN